MSLTDLIIFACNVLLQVCEQHLKMDLGDYIIIPNLSGASEHNRTALLVKSLSIDAGVLL